MAALNKIDKFHVLGVKGIIFLIPFIPLYVTPSIAFPYIAGKNFAFRVLVEFAAALWLGLMSTSKEYRLRSSPITLSILIFTFIVGLADLIGVSPYNSFWSNYERMEGYITILHLALYFIIVKSVLRTEGDWKIFFNLFIAVGFLVSIYALITPPPETNSSQFAIVYGRRVYGTIGNPPFLASYLLLSVFLGFVLIFNTQKLYLKFIYLFLIIVDAVTMYMTSSRGAILGAIVGGIMFMFLHVFGKTDIAKEKRIKKAALLVIGIIVIASGIYFAFNSINFTEQDRTLSRFATMFSDESVQNRIKAWKFAWEGIKERPILGWGQENYFGVYTVNPLPFVHEQVWFDRAHNIIIDWLINAGLLGLFSYVAIFITAFYVLWRTFQKKTISNNEVLTIVTALAVYFFHNLFTFDTINTYLLFFTLLAYIDYIDLSEKDREINGFNELNKIKIRLVYVTLPALFIISFPIYYLNYKPIKESQLYIRTTKSSTSSNSFSNLLNEINKALSLNTFGDALVRQGMKKISFDIIRYEFIKQEGALKFIETTARELDKGIAYNRHNLKYLTDVITFYNQGAFYEPSFIAKTEALISECMRLNPEYQWLYMALADVYVAKKDYEGAFSNVKKITDWDAQNDMKQFKLAMASIFTLREDVVSRSLEIIRKIRTAENKRIASGKESVFSADEIYQLAQVYMEMRNLNEALRYYKELMTVLSYDDMLYIKRDYNLRVPEIKAKLHIEIAKIYLALGHKESAIREAKRAVELAPGNYTSEAESIIYSLNN